MNNRARRILMNRRTRDYRRRDYDYDMERRDYENRNRDYEDRDYEYDGKQGVKGTGPYGIGGRLYSRSRDYDERDYDDYDERDYERDGRRGRRNYDYDDYDYEMDGHHPSGLMKLKKKDYMKWEKHLENADGTQGKHFDAQQISKIAEQLGIQYRGYTEKDLVMTANMLYSDFCKSIKNIRPDLTPEKEVIAYTKMAQDWLEDPDSPVEGSEKLALYYWCIVNDEE